MYCFYEEKYLELIQKNKELEKNVNIMNGENNRLYQENNQNKGKLSQYEEKYLELIQKNKELVRNFNNLIKFNDFVNKYNSDQEKIKNLFREVSSHSALISKKVDLIDNYTKNKYYFFNGQEDLFKDMDTDFFFQMCFFNNIKLLSHSPTENRIYLKTEDGIILVTNNRFLTIDAVFARNEYSVPQLHSFKDFVVFDIGMNRGYASLKFASYDTCKAVYGFEIDPKTYNLALENFNLNPSLNDKIHPYNFGLYDEECELDLFYMPGYDGITTARLEFTKTSNQWIEQKKQMKTKKAKVKEAGKVISDIIENEKIKSNIVLKIDTEGSESKIMDNLISNGIIDKIDLIMGEVHLETEDLENKLTGFKRIHKNYTSEKIYNFCFVKKDFYKILDPAKIIQ